MKLDIGCGDRCRGDVCLDITRTKTCNIIADAHFLPFPNNVFIELQAKNVLEHCEVPTKALREWFRVLKPNGIATIICPKSWITNDALFVFVYFFLNLPFSLLPRKLSYHFVVFGRMKKESRWRHKFSITTKYMQKQANELKFDILEVTAMQDLLFSIVETSRRLHKFFQFKPKVWHLNKFICVKQGDIRK